MDLLRDAGERNRGSPGCSKVFYLSNWTDGAVTKKPTAAELEGADLGSVIDQEPRLGHNDFEMPLNVPVAIATRQLNG